MTIPHVLNDPERALSYWQNRLHLSDWIIKLRLHCAPEDMNNDNVSGEVTWTECHKTAVILILDERYYGERILPYDADDTLIHELLHLKFCLLGENGNDVHERVLHQVICDLAAAFNEDIRREAVFAEEQEENRDAKPE